MNTFTKEQFKQRIITSLKRQYNKKISEAHEYEIYYAVSRATMDEVVENWNRTQSFQKESKVKNMYYFSAEFLMGRYLGNNLINLKINKVVSEILEELGLDLNILEDNEMEAGLGSGGLGRLAACFLESLSTLSMPGHGYGLRYKYGMFKQKIENGFQVEYPDEWQKKGTPWSIKRIDRIYDVKFGGSISIDVDNKGFKQFKRVDTENVLAVAYDVPIIGYGNSNVNKLRLWEARSKEGFDLNLFNNQEYLKASEKAIYAEDISRVLYPNDTQNQGKILRLKQQFFFTSASLQDIVRNFKVNYGNDFSIFSDKVCIQLNDTHPVVAIPELMRIFLDYEKLGWEKSWSICTKVFSYTNHTILEEALEKWETSLFNPLLPRIYQIIEEIDKRFIEDMKKTNKFSEEDIKKISIINNDKINMANLAIIASHKVNGVSSLHTDILKNKVLKHFYEIFPEKFVNITNGITQRRWLLNANPELSDFIESLIGNSYITKLEDIKRLEKYIDDTFVLEKIREIKRVKKLQLIEYIEKTKDIKIDVNSIFNVHVKRIHEYKRQVLNILYIIDLYFKIKSGEDKSINKRTFIFAGKSAAGYKIAKDIIKLINSLEEVINNDKEINDKIKVVFLENYSVSMAEKIIPAADISIQISTAGKEASGTGNMKFMLNGGLTLGTLDGANVEIEQEVGKDNIYIFGLKSEEIKEYDENEKYIPMDEYLKTPGLQKAVDSLVDGTFDKEKTNVFKDIRDSLLYGLYGEKADKYYVLKDFSEYRKAQNEIDNNYNDNIKWSKMMLINILSSSKFSSDRSIKEYSEKIWDIKSLKQ